jgi:hypothetical protein
LSAKTAGKGLIFAVKCGAREKSSAGAAPERAISNPLEGRKILFEKELLGLVLRIIRQGRRWLPLFIRLQEDS